MKKILIVDDEPDILEFLKYNLRKENFDCYTSKDGIDAIEIAKKVIPDLIILDVMMPQLDGFEVCRKLREIDALKKTLIIFLTARFEDYNQIEGLNSGADDYIVKPIKLGILISKIKAFFRRENQESSDSILIRDIVIDKTSYTINRNSVETNLSKKEFEILYLLASKPKKVFSREEIYSKIWGNEIYESNRTIDVHIRQIRKKAGKDLIFTVKRIGYKFE
jgi:two-component system, OmpR family, alkaline phosphatase synthesis response regulator PhoP